MPNNNGGLLRDQANIYYVMRFGDYYTGDHGIRGRIAELATIKGDGSYTYEEGYVLGVPDESIVFLFTDQEVSILVNSLNVYNHHVDDSFVNFPFDALPKGDNDEIAGNNYFDGKIKEASDNVCFALDPNWNNNDSDSSTPHVQIAQGQSDITRHESYFKEEMSPKYTKSLTENVKALMQELGISDPKDIVFTDFAVPQTYQNSTSPLVANLASYLDANNMHPILIGQGTEVMPYGYLFSDFIQTEGDEEHPFNFQDMIFPSENTVTLSGYSDQNLSLYRFFSKEDFECLDGIATVVVQHNYK